MPRSEIIWLIGCYFFLVGLAHADQPSFVSPNGRYILTTEENDDQESFRVNLIDARTNKVMDSYNPETRAMGAFWNPTSKMVAINEDISHETGNLSLFRIVGGRLKSITLPRKLRWEDVKEGDGFRQVDAIYHYLPAVDAKRINFWWGGHQPMATGWINPTDLGVDVEGIAQLEGKLQLEVDYEVVIHVVPPKVSILSETRKRYEITAETN